MDNFTEIRRLLLDPREEGRRKEAAHECRIYMATSVIALIAGVSGTFFGLLIRPDWPFVGSLVAIGGSLVALAGGECLVFFNNIENLLSSGFTTRFTAIATRTKFLSVISSNTWLIESIIRFRD